MQTSTPKGTTAITDALPPSVQPMTIRLCVERLCHSFSQLPRLGPTRCVTVHCFMSHIGGDLFTAWELNLDWNFTISVRVEPITSKISWIISRIMPTIDRCARTKDNKDCFWWCWANQWYKVHENGGQDQEVKNYYAVWWHTIQSILTTSLKFDFAYYLSSGDGSAVRRWLVHQRLGVQIPPIAGKRFCHALVPSLLGPFRKMSTCFQWPWSSI